MHLFCSKRKKNLFSQLVKWITIKLDKCSVSVTPFTRKRLIHRIFTIKVCNFCAWLQHSAMLLYIALILLSYYSILIYYIQRAYFRVPKQCGYVKWEEDLMLRAVSTVFSFSLKSQTLLTTLKIYFFILCTAGRALKTHPPVQFNTDQTPVGLLWWTYC